MLNADYSTGHHIATTAASSNVFDKTCEVAVLVTTTSSLQLLEVLPLVNDPHEFIVAILSNFNKEVYRGLVEAMLVVVIVVMRRELPLLTLPCKYVK